MTCHGQTSIATSIPKAQETSQERFQKELEKWMVVFCSSSFQAGMFHNGKSFANTREVKKPHKALEVPEISKIHKAPSPGVVTARSSEKRPSSCQSCSPRSHIWKNRLRSRLCRMSHMIWWQCSLCKCLPSSVPCWTHSSGFFVCLFALVLSPVM